MNPVHIGLKLGTVTTRKDGRVGAQMNAKEYTYRD